MVILNIKTLVNMKRFFTILLRNILLIIIGFVVGIRIIIATSIFDYNIYYRNLVFGCIVFIFMALLFTYIEFYKIGAFSESTEEEK